MGLFISGIYALMLFGFAGIHYYMVLQNSGTLDTIVQKHKGRANMYDLGPRVNFCQVFGDDPKYWFIPVFTSQGDGLSYPTNECADEQEETFGDSLETDQLVGL